MKLLMHMCCGPCSCYPLKKLRADGIEPVGYFFNPNIHPYQEWNTRLKTAKCFAEKTGMEFVADDRYLLRDFLRRALAAEGKPALAAAGTQEEALAFVTAYKLQKDRRCRMCYTWRLEQAARFAAEGGYSAFTSTLFYSIYQQHDVMKQLAEHFAQVYGVEFYYEDFRAGWQEGIDISLELGLYRQAYCGCVFSEEERYSRTMKKAAKKAHRVCRRDAEARRDVI
ncbi:MAG: epoxyqueuosine reductase QueH [Schwartzia sp.]|nr:epoxyqueuosine reductase QueH [Schwartzia sp. (in: firmicutes)]